MTIAQKVTKSKKAKGPHLIFGCEDYVYIDVLFHITKYKGSLTFNYVNKE